MQVEAQNKCTIHTIMVLAKEKIKKLKEKKTKIG